MYDDMVLALKVTIPSRRFYFDEMNLSDDITQSICLTIEQFNVMKEWTYNKIYDNRVLGILYEGSLTQMIKNEYHRRYGGKLSDYYASTLYTSASGIVSSQKELFKQYEEEYNIRQDYRREKIKELSDSLNEKREIKKLIIDYDKATRNGTEFDENKFHTYGVYIIKNNKHFEDNKIHDSVQFYGKRNKKTVLSFYSYECMIDAQIKNLKKSIGSIKAKIKRAEEKKPIYPRRATFGARKKYRAKDTKKLSGKELEQWHTERNLKRFSSVDFNGRHTSKYGNFQCKYDPVKATCTIVLIDGKELVLSDVSFPYRGEELIAYRQLPEHPALGYSLELHKDGHGRMYLILKASFTAINDFCNSCPDDGIVAVDVNYDHLAWADVNSDGTLKRCGKIPFSLDGMSSGRRKSVLGHAVKQLIDICVKSHKPLAMENLKIKVVCNEYDSSAKNRKLSSFASHEIPSLIEGQALQQGLTILKVNPAYTSLLGKIKYMKPYGISIHCAAALVIGRMAMCYKEHLPSNLRGMYYTKTNDGTVKNAGKSAFSAYSYIFKHIKKAPVSFWYQNVNFSTWKEFDSLVTQYLQA